MTSYLDHHDRHAPRDAANLAHILILGTLFALAALALCYYGIGAALWFAEKVRPL